MCFQDLILKDLGFLNFVLHALLLEALDGFVDQHQGSLQIAGSFEIDGGQSKVSFGELIHSSEFLGRLDTFCKEALCLFVFLLLEGNKPQSVECITDVPHRVFADGILPGVQRFLMPFPGLGNVPGLILQVTQPILSEALAVDSVIIAGKFLGGPQHIL